MATDAEPSRSQEYAERPKEGELWKEMIERQQREDSNRGGNWRELLRSLPDEQQKEKGPGRGDNIHTVEPLMADTFPQSYAEMLREASQRAAPDQSQELER